VGQAITGQLLTEFGVPQGGILSPLIFTVLYMGQTLKNEQTTLSILTYADNTSTSCHGKLQEKVLEKLEEDSKKKFTIHCTKW
jgi:hypothetical protein